MKRTETIRISLVIGAINELRYAGYHFVESCSATDANESAEQLDKAKKHCQRAIYDASEAELLHRIGHFKRFQEDFSTVPIETSAIDYKSALAAFRDAQDLLLKRDPEKRELMHQKMIDMCDLLTPFEVQIDDARNELNKVIRQRALDQKREKEKRDKEVRRWALGLTVAVMLGVVGTVAKCAPSGVGPASTEPSVN